MSIARGMSQPRRQSTIGDGILPSTRYSHGVSPRYLIDYYYHFVQVCMWRQPLMACVCTPDLGCRGNISFYATWNATFELSTGVALQP